MKAKTAMLFRPGMISEKGQEAAILDAQCYVAEDIDTLVYCQTGIPGFGAACLSEFKKAIGLDYRGLRDNLPHEEFKRLYMGDWIMGSHDEYCPECERARRWQYIKSDWPAIIEEITPFTESDYEKQLRALLIDKTEPPVKPLTSGDSTP